MKRISCLRPRAVAILGGPLILITSTLCATAAESSAARAVCAFSNPSFAGQCKETTDVRPGSSPRKACEEILACLNNAACIKSYCEATTIRQGWPRDSATAADDAPKWAPGEAPPWHGHAAGEPTALGASARPLAC